VYDKEGVRREVVQVVEEKGIVAGVAEVGGKEQR
jgi:hypothetical protein